MKTSFITFQTNELNIQQQIQKYYNQPNNELISFIPTQQFNYPTTNTENIIINPIINSFIPFLTFYFNSSYT